MSAIYIPHRHVTYNYDNVDNSNINQHYASTHRIESSDVATPLQHSNFIESKLKSSGVAVKRLSDVHLEVDNVKIETHPNGTYLLGKDKSKLHDLHSRIHGINRKSNFKDALKGFLTNKKQNNELNTDRQELMFEDVTESYVFESMVNDQTKRIRVKAPNKQLAEEAAELYFKIHQEAK